MSDHTTTATEGRAALLDRMAADGARLETGDDGPTRVRSFGDVDEEYRALTEAAAVVDDTDRAIVRVREGRKAGRAHETLAGLLTNHFEAVDRDRALYSFLLTAKGGPVAELRAIRREGEDWLDLPHACREGTLRHLEKYLPPLLARYAVDESAGRLGVVGPRATVLLGAAAPELKPTALAPLEGADALVADVETFVLRRGEAEPPGFDLYLPTREAPRVWRTLLGAAADVGGRAAGRDAREARRVELGIPAYGHDITESTLPHETGQTDRAVSFDKGCYTGQEVVVRIEHRGQVNRRLAGLSFDDELPEAGAAVYRGERDRGTVTTPVRSPRMGAIALAYVRREVEAGSRLALEPGGEPACTVRDLPFPD